MTMSTHSVNLKEGEISPLESRTNQTPLSEHEDWGNGSVDVPSYPIRLERKRRRECHRHGRLCDYRSTLFLYFAKSNSSPTFVDLIFLLILSIHVALILSYPYIFTFIPTHSLSFFQMRWLLFYDVATGTREDSYLFVHWRTVFLG